MKKQSWTTLFGSLCFLWASTASAALCTVEFGLDQSVWYGGKWGSFFIEHPGNTVSNLVTSGDGCPAGKMKATFTCGKTTYLEIHVVNLDPSIAANEKPGAVNSGFLYWSRCFGMLPDYMDGQENVLQFPNLRGTRNPGNTGTYFRYENPPDCADRF
ncbi:MAG: hypothetical protein A3F14_03080 [Gammaproteobacteria bacterium RIFCSPHIGHO2_12_FULL_43_28]|nr:MAG: hypothetical protein A3F14_03080 [Gammaproteobacteria bacterium RIFCSPHIGHO2_12_FULL_43_28]